ncbi:MAG: hypothetical protein HPY83_09890 [Anaerolineae bacterium]|nr:hypothetical protein [Anaerolineae bacterium]
MPQSPRPRAHKSLYLGTVVLLALLLVGGAALAQTGGPYDLTWHTFDGGGGTTSGGPYALSGTIGQPDAQVMTGDPYTLQGGFWGGSASGIVVYTPLVLRNAG